MFNRQEEIAWLSEKLDEISEEIKGAVEEMGTFKRRAEQAAAGSIEEFYNLEQYKKAKAGFDTLQTMHAQTETAIHRIEAGHCLKVERRQGHDDSDTLSLPGRR